MYFRVNLNMKKPTLCCYFTKILFIELNFKVAFLLIRIAWDDWFAGKVGEMGLGGGGGGREGGGGPGGGGEEMGGEFLVMREGFLNGRWYPFTDYGLQKD